jgi:hypothetical protein
MQHDKAIIKVLGREERPSLSGGFNERAMQRIYREVVRKKRRAFVWTVVSVSAVSLVLIGLAGYLLNRYTTGGLHIRVSLPQFDSGVFARYEFCFYIALLVVVLMGFDHLLRGYWSRKKIKAGNN